MNLPRSTELPLDEGKRKGLTSFLAFIALYFLAIQFLPRGIVEGLVSLTSRLVVVLANLGGLTADGEGNIVSVSGFPMTVSDECTGIYLFFIYSTAVLVFPGHSLLYKAAGVGAGLTFLVFVNAVRIIALGVIGSFSREVFDFMHIFMWEGLFTLLVILVWFVWAKGLGKNHYLIRTLGKGVSLAMIVFILLSLVMKGYLGFLAWVADGFFGLVSAGILSITSSADGVVYHYDETTNLFPIAIDVFDSGIFFVMTGLMLNRTVLKKSMALIVGAICCISALHLLFITLIGYAFLKQTTGQPLNDILVFTRGISILVPILLGLAVRTAANQGQRLVDAG